MKWFPGPLTLATQVSQRNKALLVVFVESSNDKGKQMSELWEKIEPSIFSCNHVAVHLKQGDGATISFAEKYPTPILPATYFINNDGNVIDIITLLTNVDLSEFERKIRKAVQTFSSASSDATFSNTTVASPASSSSASVVSNTATTTAASTSQLEIEEKIKRAKEKLEKKRLEDEEKKRQEEKEKELQRVEMGKQMAETQKKKQEQELIEAANERKKDKILAEETKRRVRAQIQADREEREYRQRLRDGGATTPNTPNEQKDEVLLNKPVRSDTCRVLIRFIDGTSFTEEFSSSDPLRSVVDLIKEEARVSGPFSLVNSYPRKVFSPEDFDKSFIDLQLTPSCTLFIEQLQKQQKAVASTNGLQSLITMLVMAPWNCICAVLGLIFGRNNASVSNTQVPTTRRAGPSSAPSQDNQQRNRPFAGATVRRRGNVAGLHNRNGDESEPEDNPNWNGNSTQFL